MLRGANTVRGYSIEAVDGDIGKAADFYFDNVSWRIHSSRPMSREYEEKLCAHYLRRGYWG